MREPSLSRTKSSSVKQGHNQLHKLDGFHEVFANAREPYLAKVMPGDKNPITAGSKPAQHHQKCSGSKLSRFDQRRQLARTISHAGTGLAGKNSPLMIPPKRTTFDPEKCGGHPCIRGMRIRVKDVSEMLGGGANAAEIPEDFPYLDAEDITACPAFAAAEMDYSILRSV